MNQDEIKKLAIECGLVAKADPSTFSPETIFSWAFDELAAYTAAVEARERERCANRCVAVRNHYINTPTYSIHEEVMLCAAASDCESAITELA